MTRKSTCTAFTLVEVMVVVLLLGIVMTASSMVFVAGQGLYMDTSVRSEVQTSVMQALYRVSLELQNSGYDSANTFQVSVLDNAGQGGTDILRFSVPMCVCGMSPFDSTGSVRAWGAPLIWGQSGCETANYVVDNTNKVDICHFLPGNSENSHDLSVSVNAIPAHLAHGDYIGDCSACSPASYTNKTIEYLVDANGQFLRRVLTSSNSVIRTAVIAQQVTTFQVAVDGLMAPLKHSTANVTIGATKNGLRGRAASVVNNVDVLFRNR
jgi:prepilin-type N-terminal cleavage/methylation domain-containing protein